MNIQVGKGSARQEGGKVLDLGKHRFHFAERPAVVYGEVGQGGRARRAGLRVANNAQQRIGLGPEWRDDGKADVLEFDVPASRLNIHNGVPGFRWASSVAIG